MRATGSGARARCAPAATQGEFPLRLYTITTERLGERALKGAVDHGFEVAAAPAPEGEAPLHYRSNLPYAGTLAADVGRFERADAPEALQALLRDVGAWTGGQPLWLRVLYANRFGAGDADPSTWREDFAIPGVDEGARLEGRVEPGAGDEAEPVTLEMPGSGSAGDQEAGSDASGGCGGCGECSVAGSGAPAGGALLLVWWALVRRRRAQ